VKIKTYPQPHKVFNEFDQFGELLDLKRIQGEDNVQYKQRLLDVMVHRSDSTYLGLIYGITRELGLKILDVLEVLPAIDGNGDTLAAQPAIVFQDTHCYIYSDFDNNVIHTTLSRFDSTDNAYTMGTLVNKINATGIMSATLLPGADTNSRSMTIFNQQSIIDVTDLDISDAGVRIVLPHRNLIRGSVSIQSNSLLRQVNSEIEIVASGDYFIDRVNGMIVTSSAPSPGSIIRYKYRDDRFIVRSSPVIIHNLQSEDFKKKMFTQTTDSQGNTYSGAPTNLGADIINELLSVYPSLWGK
jgi:hypothetical protein